LITAMTGVTGATVSSLCTSLKSKNSSIDCSSNEKILSSLNALLNKNSTTCTKTNETEAPLNVVIDLQFKECQKISVGCSGSAGLLTTVTNLLKCILSNVGALPNTVVTATGTVVSAVGKLPDTICFVLLIVWSVLGSVIGLLCKLDEKSLGVLLCGDLPLLIFGILVAATVGASRTKLLGMLLGPIIGLLTALLSALIKVLTCITSGLVSNLLGGINTIIPIKGGLLKEVSLVLVAILNVLTKIPSPCSVSSSTVDAITKLVPV